MIQILLLDSLFAAASDSQNLFLLEFEISSRFSIFSKCILNVVFVFSIQCTRSICILLIFYLSLIVVMMLDKIIASMVGGGETNVE